MSIFSANSATNGVFSGIGDGISFMLILSALMEFLPPISALLSIIWLVIRIYETETVQCWLNCNKKLNEEPRDKSP